MSNLFKLVFLAPLSLLASCVSGGLAEAARAPSPVSLELRVDATNAPRKRLHAHMRIPAHPGAMTLAYPKWIPGEHGPTGPVDNIAGLVISALGKPIPWRRDDADMYSFHCDVPAGASAIEVELDYLIPATGTFTGGPSATDKLLDLAWNHVLLYPQGLPADAFSVSSSLQLPKGWKFGSALPVLRQTGESVEFSAVPLTTLVDSPVVAGEYFRTIPLDDIDGAAHRIDMVADSKAALEMKSTQIEGYHRLVAEAHALFGAHHYRNYDFLYVLSDHLESFGLEHHESSDNRLSERALLDDDESRWSASLLPHEFVHSWNGKYRRPRGLHTPDYQTPMKSEMLWVYEGLTEYLGLVLTARSGLFGTADFLDLMALTAASMDNRPGRAWRSLLDTTISGQRIFSMGPGWTALRRSADFYPEGALIWLEADVIIRQKTNGARSLDDFCQRFHGGKSGGAEVAPYTYDDLLRVLGEVAPYDWRGFFDARIQSTAPRAPLGGIAEGGYKLEYDENKSDAFAAQERYAHVVDESFSLGLLLRDDGGVVDVIPGRSAAESGITPGARLIAVDKRRYSPARLYDAIRAAKTGKAPIELLVERGEFFETHRLDYHGGARYPHLVRDTKRKDLLSAIAAPHTKTRATKTGAPNEKENENKHESGKKE